MLVVGYSVNNRCPEVGLGRKILGESRGTLSDRARRRGFEQHLDTFQSKSGFDQGGRFETQLLSYFLMEESSPSLSILAPTHPTNTPMRVGRCPSSKGSSIFHWSVREITHSRDLVILAFTLAKRKIKMFSFWKGFSDRLLHIPWWEEGSSLLSALSVSVLVHPSNIRISKTTPTPSSEGPTHFQQG